MVTKESMAGGSNKPAALPATSDKRMQLFNQLKPFTSQLLRARDAPARLQSLLLSLQNVIRDADLDGLNSRGIFDYILFPLMPGVDSVVLMRRPGDKTASSKLPYPAAQSDAVAEAILYCCVLLMQRCPIQSGEQLSDLLEHFVTVVNLGKASATEEVRLKAIQCISAMLSSKPSSSGKPFLALREPSRAPMLGFSFSALLKAAEEEVQAGLTGSKALTAAVLEAIKHLIQGVGSGDALAFVLPGLASGFSKILIVAGSTSRRPSGSRVGSRAAVQALQAFTSLVTLTLGDAHAQRLAEGEQAAAELSAVQALDALQKLAVQRPQEPQASAAGDNAGAEQRPAAGSSMRCNRSKDWIQHTPFRLTGLIGQTLPPLAAHPRTAVRVALAQGVTALLEHCSPVLTGATELLYEVLFTLAQDDWPQVSAHCQTWLASWLPRHCQAGPAGRALPAIVERLLLGLVPALRSGEEAATLHARRLTTALQACSQQQLTSLLLNSPVSAASWAPTLCRCFAFERSTAALLMYNTSQAGPHASLGRPQLAPSTPPKHPDNNQPSRTPHTALDTETHEPNPAVTPGKPVRALQSETTASEQAKTREGGAAATPTLSPTPSPAPAAQQASATARASDDSNSTELATVVLPRMPLGLKHITMPTAYTAVADVARALGRCSVAAGCERPSHSGSAVLHGITQALLQIFEAQVPAQSPGRHINSSDLDMPASAGWQGKAASAVVALAEVIFGASASWQGTQQQQQQQGTPDFSSQPSQHDSSTTATQAATSSDSGTAHAGSDGREPLHSLSRSHPADAAVHTDHGVLEPIVVQALDDFSNAGVWSLATHIDPDATPPGNTPLTPQVLGENAVLIRAMLEAVGVFARVLGRRFATSGVILRKVLLVLLERLADPCPSVATSAAAALGAVCLHCGYASRQALLAANADYLVDGLCRQLRSLDSHPRGAALIAFTSRLSALALKAPYLFAAVLQQAGAGQELLPLLADPARAAFQGLSITARHHRAFHIHPFLQVLMHIVTICEAEAAALLGATQDAANQIREALVATQPQAEDSQEEEELESLAQASRIDAVRAFFEEHHRRKARAANDDPTAAKVSFDQGSSMLEEVSSRRRQIHSVAVLAHASAEVATPLLLSATLKVGLLALKVGHVALRALHSTTAALDLYEQVITPVTSKQGVQPPPPDTPQMLPSVHVLWGALVGALRDTRPALVQGALQCLVGICQLAGVQFMTRRVQTEAWPVLVHLMRHGTPQQSKAAYPSDQGSRTAPAALQQMRYSVLQCIGQLASTGTRFSVWRGMTDKVAEALAVFLDNAQTSAVREAAAQAILCVSKEDPDAVWLALHLVHGLHQLHGKPNPNAAVFPDASRLLQAHSRLSSGDVAPVQLSVKTLLQEVENMQANWHSQCSE